MAEGSAGSHGRLRRSAFLLAALVAVAAAVASLRLVGDDGSREVAAGARCEGSFVLAWGYPPRNPEIWVARVGRTGRPTAAPVTSTGFSAEPAVSPDGRTIAFVDARGQGALPDAEQAPGRTELWTMRPDGSGQQRLLSDGRWSFRSPSWSYDGRFLTVALSAHSEPEAGGVRPQAIGIVDVGTRELRTAFTAGPGEEVAGPSWSPTDQEVVFTHRTQGGSDSARYQIRTVAVAGGGQSRVLFATEPPFAEELLLPRFSPDGAELAFERQAKIVSLRLDTGAQRVVGNGRIPMWAPDGSAILFVAGESENQPAIVEHPVSGQGRRPVVPLQDLPLAGASAQITCPRGGGT